MRISRQARGDQRTVTNAMNFQSAIVNQSDMLCKIVDRNGRRCFDEKLTFVSAFDMKFDHRSPLSISSEMN